MLMHRVGRLLIRAASLLTTLALLAGLPAALAAVVGWPLPRRLPNNVAGWEAVLTGGFPDQAVINLLACALWLVWAAFCYSLIGEIAAARRGRPVRRVRALSPVQALAALLVAGMSAGPAAAATLVVPPAVVTTVTPPSAAVAAPELAARAGSTAAAPLMADSSALANRSASVTALPALVTAAAEVSTPLPRFALVAHSGPLTVTTAGHDYTVTVKRGDTLWELADRWLGDPHRWPEIYQLNADRYDDNGRMLGGDHIERGWVLTLPDDAVPPPGTRPATPPQLPPAVAGPNEHPGTPATPLPTTPVTDTPAPTPPSTPATTTPPRPEPHSSTAAPNNPPPAAARPTPTPSPTGDRTGATETSAPTNSPAPSSAIAGDAAGQQPQPERSRTASPGISLASGSWLDLGLAAAVAAAVALVWAHRRRRYTPRPLSPDLRLDDPGLAPMPSVVTQIRRRLRDDPQAADTDAAAAWTTPTSTTATHTLNFSDIDPAEPPRGKDDRDAGEPADPTAATGAEADPARDVSAAPAARPVVPASTNPAAAVWPSSGLGLTGPGAESAARGFLAAALADSDAGTPPGQVMLPSTTAATLLGAAAVTLPSTPRLVVTDDLAEALSVLEQQILHRSRLVYTHEVDTVTAMRAADPYEEPTPPILLLADATSSHERTRIAALLAQGQRLDIHGILLSDWPAGDTIIVDTDGSTTAGDTGRHGHHPADVGRLAVLTPAETVAVITTLAEAHTGLPQPPPPAEPQPHRPTTDAEPASSGTAGIVLPLDDAGRVLTALADHGDATAAAIAAHLALPYPTVTTNLVQWEHTGHAETIRTDTGQTVWRLTATGHAALGVTKTTLAAEPAGTQSDTDQPTSAPETGEGAPPTADRYAEIGTALQWPDPSTAFTSEHPQPPAPNTVDNADNPGHVEVTVLGEAGIVATNPDRRPRRKALELLVYLAVHDGSATVEAILDDLLPDAPASKAPERLHTYVSDLRAVMRRIGGPATYLTHPHQRYSLNHDAIDIDLWRMRTAIREAHQATDPQQRIDALQRAVDCYRGPLADGAHYEWAEPYREAIRQQALDAHLALADAITDDPAAQARTLEAAISHSPYSEQLYQQAMRARAALGHLDAIRTLRRALDRALAEIDAEASDETITLADQLITDLQRPGRRTDIETASGSN
ncbi:BTAD domain-containing putative transcriptional regulator [Actinoplanes aureus]|uniref:BTAD domain-containing putative transcriptional regulator n=1 Tax=Actinoplanes aureus TaxID=2792083 RepID=UPI0027149CD7|nr:BTAD domain-containing putative transcriptional regulator [Actinoplanes aureus]